jgi:hypothetical protein
LAYFRMVASLAPQLPPDRTAAVLDQALDAAGANDDNRQRAQALAVLIPSLPEARIPEALKRAPTPDDYGYLVLAPLVPRLQVAKRQDAIARILDAVRGQVLELPGDFVEVLRPLAAYLNDAQVVAALTLAGEISDYHDSLKADALAILAPRLRHRERDIALSMAEGLQDDLSYVRAVAGLASSLSEHVPAAVLHDAHETARRLQDNEARMQALIAIAPFLTDRLATLSEGLEAAMAIEEDDRRAHALADLLLQLAGRERLDGFEYMLRSCLGSRVVRVVGSSVIREGIDRAFLLERIADASGVVAAIGGESAVAETARVIQEVTVWWP